MEMGEGAGGELGGKPGKGRRKGKGNGRRKESRNGMRKIQ
jgi:hypothetical protein